MKDQKAFVQGRLISYFYGIPTFDCNCIPSLFFPQPETRTPKEKPGGPKNNRAQSSIPAAFAAASKYKSDSLEQRAKEQAIALWIGRTACTVEDEDFIFMMETFDKRLTIPKRTKINNFVDKMYDD